MSSNDICCTVNYTSCILNDLNNNHIFFILNNFNNFLIYTFNGLLRVFFDPGDSSLYRYLFGNLGEISRSQLLNNKNFYEFLITILSVNILSTIMFIIGIIYLFGIYLISIFKIFNFKNNILLLLFIILSIVYFALISSDEYSNSRFRLIFLPFFLIILSVKK
jgi:hypothetical protein